MLFLFSSNFVFSCFSKRQTWVNVQFALNRSCALEVYGVFAVYHLGFSSKQFQSCNKSLINQACSGPSLENIGPWSFLYAALDPYCQDLGPIFSQYGPRAWLIRYTNGMSVGVVPVCPAWNQMNTYSTKDDILCWFYLPPNSFNLQQNYH